MKREIKFRVWNNNTKRYESKGFLTSSSELDNSYVLRGVMEFEQDEDDYNDDGENIVLEQFTGLKDELGKDIYEGDIVNIIFKDDIDATEYLSVSKVIWSEISLRWEIPTRKDADFGLPLNWGGYESLDVIGNIYENPELIKP